MVDILFQKGASANEPAAEKYGGTAVHLAAKTAVIGKLLLEADPYMAKPKVWVRSNNI